MNFKVASRIHVLKEKLKFNAGLLISHLRGFPGTEIAFNAKLIGKSNIILEPGTKIFANTVINTSGSPFGSVFKNGIPTGKIKVGKNCRLKGFLTIISYESTISIGNNVTINPFTSILGGKADIHIGNNVMIAANVTIVASNHIFDDINLPIKHQGTISSGIIINDDVWIATGVRILDGVQIGRGSVLAAGAVINKDVPEFAIMAGVPAKIIKYRNEK